MDRSILLAEMLRRLKHRPWYREDRHLDPAAGLALGRVTLGFVNAAAQPARNEDGSLRAVMDGEVYDYDEQRRALAPAGHTFQGDGHAELLLHGYESRGKDFFRNLNGNFAAAIWDAGRRRLVLVNDRFGMKPLYYVHLADRFLFGSAIRALLADVEVSRATSLRGVAQFFAFGQLLGEDTLLEAVRLLPAAGWLTWDAESGRLTLERHWRLEPAYRGNGSANADSLDRLDEAFQRAVDRRLGGPGRLGLSLSGGLDSRAILAVIDHERHPVTTVSMGVEGSIDHTSAERMAGLVGCRHHSYVLKGDFLDRFEEHLKEMVWLTDGHFLDQLVAMPTLPTYRELGIEVLFRGHAGELMHMDKAYSFSLDSEALALRDETALEAWLARRLRAYLLQGIDGPLFAKQGEVEALAADSLRSCLRESAGIEPPVHRIWQLFFGQRVRRETALSMEVFGSVVEPRLPYLDNDLIELLMAVPPGLKLGETIQAHILRKRRPSFLGIRNANTGTRVGAGPLARAFGQARLKVLGKLGVRGYQPYERLGLWLRRELRPLVQELVLNDRCLERGLFRPDTVRGVVERHWSQQRNHTYLLMALMIFEMGQRELVEPAVSVGPPEPQVRSCRTPHS